MEKRKHNRFLVEEFGIRAKAAFTTEVDILDISLSGARIKTPKNLNIGSNCLMKVDTESILLPLNCTVVWEHLSGSLKTSDGNFVPVYTAGIEFRDISPDGTDELRNFIGRFNLPDEQRFGYEKRLSGLRFNIHTDETALMDYKESYIIKRISVGGMLVETNYKIHIESRLPMELILPNDAHPLKFQGRIASCIEIPGEELKRFDIGIEFVNMDDSDRSKLSKFIQILINIKE